MSNNIKINKSVKLMMVKVEQKSFLDKIASTFECYTNQALTDELILDCTTINESESRDEAIALFGEEQWDSMDGMVLFHG